MGNGPDGGQAQQQPDHWTPRHPLNVARGGLAGAELGGQIFVMGGFSSGFTATLDSVEVHDRQHDTWQLVAPMPTARGNLAVAAAGGRIYAIGGFIDDTAVAAVEAFEPAHHWVQLAPLPVPRAAISAAAVGDRIYVAGGGDHRVDVYDVGDHTWSLAKPMPTVRDHPALTELDGQVYAIGGFGAGGNPLATVERYDPDHDSWHAVGPMRRPHGGQPGAATVGGRMVVVGGGLDVSEVYHPHADNWRLLAAKLPTERSALVAAHEHDQVILAIGGFRPLPTGGPLALDRVDALRVTPP